MPLTPFHFGPALALVIPLRRRIHAPTLLVASVAVDLEPLLVILLNLNYPLHGFLHTFLLALPTGLALGVVMYYLEPMFAPLNKLLFLEPEEGVGFRSFLLAGALGTVSHVLLDAPLYDDIKPLYPLTVNPFYNPQLTLDVYVLCIMLGFLGLIEYLAAALYRGFSKKR